MKCSFSIQNVHGISSEIFYFFDFSLQKKKKKAHCSVFHYSKDFYYNDDAQENLPRGS